MKISCVKLIFCLMIVGIGIMGSLSASSIYLPDSPSIKIPSILGGVGEQHTIPEGTLSPDCSPVAKRLIFYPSQDSYVNEEAPFTNTHVYAAYFFLRVRSLEGKNQRSLVQFYTGSSIPYGAEITDAELRVWLNFAPVESRIFDLYRVTESWSDVGVMWQNQPRYAEGVTSWVETGAERKWLEWNVTDDAQGFERGSFPNYGWLFRDRVEDAPYPGFFCTLRSLESPLIEYFPQLVIYYEEDVEPPVIVIESPRDGEVFYTPAVMVTGLISDNVGVSHVEYTHRWPGGSTGDSYVLDPPVSRYPFEWPVTLSQGVNTILVNGTDMTGNSVTGSLVVTYDIDSLAPNVAIQWPREGSLYIGGREIVKEVLRETVIIGKITVAVDATDGESGMDRVEFYLDNELKSSIGSGPFEWPLDEPLRGRHSVYVQGYDKGGNRAEDGIDFLIFSK